MLPHIFLVYATARPFETQTSNVHIYVNIIAAQSFIRPVYDEADERQNYFVCESASRLAIFFLLIFCLTFRHFISKCVQKRFQLCLKSP